jgi:hypothetical protein
MQADKHGNEGELSLSSLGRSVLQT